MVLPQKHYFRSCLVLFRSAHSAVDINYYKTLGLTSSASKAEIKAAYYELSKKHHPDRNKGSEESARIFRNVKEAYEVLGNEQKRIQYDKHQIFSNIRRPKKVFYPDNNPDYKDDAERIHFQSRARPFFKKHYSGKTSFYDFDAWYDGHYGKQSTNEYTFGGSKQFKHMYKIVKEEDIKILENIKRTFIFFFYLMIILAALSVGNSNKRRTI